MLKMHAILDGSLNGQNFKQYSKSGKGLSFDSFAFVCKINGEEKEIPVDWNCMIAIPQQDGTLCLHEGEKNDFGGTDELDDVYDTQYERDGYSRADITAKMLSETTEIVDFPIDYDQLREYAGVDYMHILELSFEDETGKYYVDSDVLNKFNGMELITPIKAEGDLGSYDEFNGNYPDESDLVYQQSMYIEEEEELPF